MHVDPAVTLDAKKKLDDASFGARLSSRSAVSCIMGDLSATFPGDFRLNLALNSRDRSDDPLGTHIHYQHGALTAIHYDGFSRCGRFGGAPRSFAPIDHILVDVDPHQLMDLEPVARFPAVLVGPRLMAIVRQEVACPAVQRGWPRWLAETPEFRDGTAAQSADQAPPFTDMDLAR